jgi:hypothetical protein
MPARPGKGKVREFDGGITLSVAKSPAGDSMKPILSRTECQIIYQTKLLTRYAQSLARRQHE